MAARHTLIPARHTTPSRYTDSSGASGLPCGVPPRRVYGETWSICGGRHTRAEGTPARPRSALAARKRAVRRQGSTQPAWLSACEHEIRSGLALVSGRGSFGSQELFKRAVSMQARSGGQAHRKSTSACTLRRHPCRGTLERPASQAVRLELSSRLSTTRLMGTCQRTCWTCHTSSPLKLSCSG